MVDRRWRALIAGCAAVCGRASDSARPTCQAASADIGPLRCRRRRGRCATRRGSSRSWAERSPPRRCLGNPGTVALGDGRAAGILLLMATGLGAGARLRRHAAPGDAEPPFRPVEPRRRRIPARERRPAGCRRAWRPPATGWRYGPGCVSEMRQAGRASTDWADAGQTLVTAWTKNRTTAALGRAPTGICSTRRSICRPEVALRRGNRFVSPPAPSDRPARPGVSTGGWSTSARIDGRWSWATWVGGEDARVRAIPAASLTASPSGGAGARRARPR